MRRRSLVLVGIALLAVVLTTGAYGLGIGPFADDPPEPSPEIQSLTITDRGCRGSITEFTSSSNGPNSTFTHSRVINTSSPNTELSAKSIRTSANDAAIATYRTDIKTHALANDSASCKGQLAYRIVVKAPAGPTGTRHALAIDGRVVSCAGGTSGPNSGCYRVMEYDERPPSVSTNETIETATARATTR